MDLYGIAGVFGNLARGSRRVWWFCTRITRDLTRAIPTLERNDALIPRVDILNANRGLASSSSILRAHIQEKLKVALNMVVLSTLAS